MLNWVPCKTFYVQFGIICVQFGSPNVQIGSVLNGKTRDMSDRHFWLYPNALVPFKKNLLLSACYVLVMCFHRENLYNDITST
jgi:hypothetical protein